jgi:hypothetical protein
LPALVRGNLAAQNIHHVQPIHALPPSTGDNPCLMTFPADWAVKEPPRGGSGLLSAARDGSWTCWPFDGPS